MTESFITRKIVIVDDEPAITNVIRRTLEELRTNQYELKILAFNDSNAALNFLRTATQGNVAMVLTDFNMPEVNGAKIAAEARKQNIPVAIMSGSWGDAKQNKEVKEQAGEVQKFDKPFDANELIMWVREQLAIPDPEVLKYSSKNFKIEENF